MIDGIECIISLHTKDSVNLEELALRQNWHHKPKKKKYLKQIDSVLQCLCTLDNAQRMSKCGKNRQSYYLPAPSVLLCSIPPFDVIHALSEFIKWPKSYTYSTIGRMECIIFTIKQLSTLHRACILELKCAQPTCASREGACTNLGTCYEWNNGKSNKKR